LKVHATGFHTVIFHIQIVNLKAHVSDAKVDTSPVRLHWIRAQELENFDESFSYLDMHKPSRRASCLQTSIRMRSADRPTGL
jgi:hypothetical protein